MTGKDIRCRVCTKKLAEGEYVRLSIKCQRCKALNMYERHQRAPFLFEKAHDDGRDAQDACREKIS